MAEPKEEKIKQSFLTWATQLGVLLCGSVVSFYLRDFSDSLLLYLPLALGIVLIHWFGPKVLPLAFLNSLFTLWLWDAPGGINMIVQCTREVVIVSASWLLCKNLVTTSGGLASTNSLVRFTILGIIVPDFINSFYTYNYTFINGDIERVGLLWLADFITIFVIAVPLLHFFRPVSYGNFFKLRRWSDESHPGKFGVIELAVLTLLFISLNFLTDFDRYWFIYGVGAALVAVRNGFDTVILANSIIFVINYLLPLIDFGTLIPASKGSTQELNVHLGMGTMFFTTALIGRAISDLRKTESMLTLQKIQIEKANEKLMVANKEMDRFVYSVSHDISAPLKSIKGLVNLGGMESNPPQTALYLKKIEKSVLKLEEFVAEVLDHSRTTRKEIRPEKINLPLLVAEITDNLIYLENFDKIQFKTEWNTHPEVIIDKFLIKVALNNLISNAIKYQKKLQEHKPEISICTQRENGHFKIEVRDNGEGIQDQYKDRIFEMFYRGTTSSTGSGLGLYIAKEAVERLGGSLHMHTQYGMGSTFTITLPAKPEA